MIRSALGDGGSQVDEVDTAGWLKDLPAPAVVLAPDGRVFGWNADAADLLGWKSVPEPRLGDSRARWLLRLASAVETHGQGRVVISRRRRTGARVRIELRAARYGARDMLVILRDVTDRNGTTRSHAIELTDNPRFTRQQLELVIEAVRDHAFVVLDAGGSIAAWNAGAQRLTGYDVDDIVRAHAAVLVTAPPEDVAAAISRAAMDGRAEIETHVRRRDQTEFPASATIIAFAGADARLTGFGVVIRDLSEQLQAQDELRRSAEQLRHAQKMDAIGRLAAGIAHDFKNVLTAIQGHAQFLLDDMPAAAPSRSDANGILKASEGATELIRQLLTFARKRPSRPVVVNPNTLVASIEKLLRRLIRADIALDTALADVPDVLIDPGQFEQVIVNLVVNARDAITGGGHIAISTARVHLDDMQSARALDLVPGDYVQIVVSDSGAGMSRDVQRQVFEPFFTTKAEGTGLGLSTVYGIVKQAGGHVSVYSEPGQGTTFKVYLPAQGVVDGSSPIVERDVTAPSIGSVLVIEDDESVRTMARRTLEAHGYAVLEAADGEAALRIAAAHGSIDIVISDLTLPESMGEVVAARIAEARPQMGIVLMSGFSRPALVQEGRIDDLGLFLEKPFTTAALVDVVGEAMRARVATQR